MLEKPAFYVLFVRTNGDILVVDNGLKHNLPGGYVNTDQTVEFIIRNCCRIGRKVEDYKYLTSLQMKNGRRSICNAMIYRLYLDCDDVTFSKTFYKKVEWLSASVLGKFLHDETLQLPQLHPILRHALKVHLGAGP